MTSADKILDFRIESYKLRIDYVTKQFDRMWNRFQLLLGIDTALIALIFTPLAQKRFGTVVFAALGILVSLFWFLVGAEDRYLVQLYREQLRHESAEVGKLLNLSDYVYVGDTESPTEVKQDLLQFRLRPASITRLIVIAPIVLLGGFLALLILGSVRPDLA